jgi:hypothetical protein
LARSAFNGSFADCNTAFILSDNRGAVAFFASRKSLNKWADALEKFCDAGAARSAVTTKTLPSCSRELHRTHHHPYRAHLPRHSGKRFFERILMTPGGLNHRPPRLNQAQYRRLFRGQRAVSMSTF